MEFTLIAKFFGGLALDLVKPKLGEAIDHALSPSAIEKALNQAVSEADREVPELFAPYERDGLGGIDRFLDKSFRGTAIAQLKKPLQEQGKPDAALLAKVFLREAEGHAKLKAVEPSRVEAWMQIFTEAYFQTTENFLSFQVTKDKYYRQLRAKTKKVVFSGIAVDGTVVGKPGELDETFVMPDVQRQDAKSYEKSDGSASVVPLEIAQNAQKLIQWEQQQELSLRREKNFSHIPVSAVELLKSQDERRIVILGAPGAGKTALMNYWVVTAIRAQFPEDFSPSVSGSEPVLVPVLATTHYFPVLIPIRELALKRELSVLDFLIQFVKANLEIESIPTGFFQHWLETGEALILLDGLDEVADDAKQKKVVEKIEAFLGAYPRCPAIITSRPAGYRDDCFSREQYPHYELLPFDDGKIEAFINRWYNSRIDLPSEREQRKDSLRSALVNRPRIKQLARNPLLLTIIVLIALIHQDKPLPRQRHELYNSAVDTLISTWDGIKWDEDKELTARHVLKYLDIPDIRRLMERLAYWIHTQGSVNDAENGTQIERSQLIKKLTKFIKEIKASENLETYAAKAEAETLLDKIVKDRAGLLAKQGERRYAFVHKTFQEYLCSKEILYLQEDRDSDDDDYVPYAKQHIKRHLHDPHWREVLLLLVAQQTPSLAKASLETILKAGSEYEQWLHRNVLFAGSCLAEIAKVSDSPATDEILTKLVNLEISPQLRTSSKLRYEVFRVITSLRDTPFASAAMQHLIEHQQTIKQKRFDRYQSKLEPDKDLQCLLKLLKDNNNLLVRYRAAESLVQLGYTSDAVADGLLSIVKSTDADTSVRYRAAASLVQLGYTSDAVADGLLSIVQSTDVDTSMRLQAAESLGQLNYASDTVVDCLLFIVQSADTAASVRLQAAESLIQLNHASDAVVGCLLFIVQSADANTSVRLRAAELLGQLSHPSDTVVSDLLSIVQSADADTSVRYRLAMSLLQLGHVSNAIISSLLAIFQSADADTSVRSHAAASLVQLGHASDAVADSLLAIVESADATAFVRSHAAVSLVQLGYTSDAVADSLLAIVESADIAVPVRFHSAVSLVQLGHVSDAIIKGLFDPLESSSFSWRLGSGGSDHTIQSLVELSEKSNAIEPALIQWLEQHQHETYVGNGIDVLWKLTGS